MPIKTATAQSSPNIALAMLLQGNTTFNLGEASDSYIAD
jgi:hypothetical protein